MSDLSVRNQNGSAQRIADTLMRATGGYTASLLIPAAQGDQSDAGQLGINAPNFQELVIAPVTFRQNRRLMKENQPESYELMVSATAIALQVSLLEVSSADALFRLVAGVNVAGLSLLVEGWSCSVSLGQPLLYRLLLRAAEVTSIGQGS